MRRLRAGAGSGYTGRMRTTHDRSKPSDCPSWCEDTHTGEEVGPEGHHGLRWSAVRADDGYWVDISTVQNKDGDVVVQVDPETGVAASGLA